MEIRTLISHLGLWSKGKGSMQQKLARALMDSIRHGVVSPGIRLPSERVLAHALAVSRTTVVGAYDLLRDAGWLETRTGSGTWVCARASVIAAARSAAQSGALAASPLLGLLDQRGDDDTIDFALGTPLPLTGLPEELFSLPQDEHSALVRDRLYHPFGLAALRHAIANQYSSSGLTTHPEQVLVTNGAQHALALCVALCLQRGDTALIEDPTYFGALDALRAFGARISTLPVESGGVQPSVIRDRITATAPRLIYLTPTFQNPTGSIIPAAARREIVRIVSEFGVPVIDDRTLADLILEGSPPPPLASYASDAEIFTLGSLSKLVWPGLRIGWVRAPEPMILRLARLKSALDLGSSLIPQAIAVRLVGATAQAINLRRRELKPRRDLLAELLRARLPGWKFRVPSGGLFLWVKLPEGDALEFAQVALRHGVIVLPGSTMSPVGEHGAYLRLPFLAQPETLRTGVERLVRAWSDYQSSDRRKRQHSPIIV